MERVTLGRKIYFLVQYKVGTKFFARVEEVDNDNLCKPFETWLRKGMWAVSIYTKKKAEELAKEFNDIWKADGEYYDWIAEGYF